MTADIAEFLTARLDEDEEEARAAVDECGSDGVWVNAPSCVVFTPQTEDADTWDGCISTTRYRAAHIARQDPRATLDRVAALRVVVAQHRSQRLFHIAGCGSFGRVCRCDFRPRCGTCFNEMPPDDEDADYELWPCPTLRALASAYRRHPEFDEAWAMEVRA